MIVTLTMNCTHEDDAITTSMKDVSTRITGYGTETAGKGAPLTVTGSELDKVLRVFIGNVVVPARAFTSVEASSITFTVPASAALGENDVLFVFEGSERAFSSVEVTSFQSVTSFAPYSASVGETVTILGADLDMVDDLKLDGQTVTMSSKSPNMIKFTVPDGATSGLLTLTSLAGTSTTEALPNANLIVCDSDPDNAFCAEGEDLLNGSLELGDGDNFNNWGQWNGGDVMTETKVASEVFRGERALKVTRTGTLGTGEWRLQFASDPVATEIGASYTVYIWAKASATGGAMRVSTNPNAVYTGNQDVQVNWTRHAFTFTANELSTRVVLDMNGNNTIATTFYVDDIKLVKN